MARLPQRLPQRADLELGRGGAPGGAVPPPAGAWLQSPPTALGVITDSAHLRGAAPVPAHYRGVVADPTAGAWLQAPPTPPGRPRVRTAPLPRGLLGGATRAGAERERSRGPDHVATGEPPPGAPRAAPPRRRPPGPARARGLAHPDTPRPGPCRGL